MAATIRHYIDGKWSEDTDFAASTLTDPATGRTTATVQLGTEDDVDRAVTAARAAFPAWSMTTVAERVDVLAAIHLAYEARSEEMAEAVTSDMGMPLANSRMAVGAALFQIQQLVDGLPGVAFEEEHETYTIRREAIGVAALIPPWNYPALQMTEKVAPALAAGCTMVLKPAEIASQAGAVFAQIMHDAQVPAGVFNMVVGKGSVVGNALSRHPEVDVVAFTGSTSVGSQVQRDAAATIKRVGLELGGKSAFIVLDDADLDVAAATAVGGVMGNSGQTCAAPTRVLVPDSRAAEFIDRVHDLVDALSVGDPLTEVDMGPVVSQAQWDTVQSYIRIGIDEGATLVAGGPGKPDGLDHGCFVRPTVFADVTKDMRIAREEIFGPVMSIITYDTADEAVRLANDSPYGLAAYIQGRDESRVRAIANSLRAGQVIVNGAYPDLTAPFGGYKQSGNGRVWGLWGLDEYLETKAVVGAR